MTTIEDDNNQGNLDNQVNKRPELLKILCILTYIGSGLSLISNSIMFLTIDIIREFYENGSFDFLAKDLDLSTIEILISANAIFFMLQAILFALSIYGAYLMWNLKKAGFHFYTMAQIVLLILPQVFISGMPFPTFELLLSLIFVTLYARNLKLMT